MSNVVLECIYRVLRNLVRKFNISQTYVDRNDPWTGILAAVTFSILSTNNRLKDYSTGWLIFGCDVIIPIKHKLDWWMICQKNQVQINKDNIRKIDIKLTTNIAGDNSVLTNHTALKYETPYNVPFVITQCFTNGTVML